MIDGDVPPVKVSLADGLWFESVVIGGAGVLITLGDKSATVSCDLLLKTARLLYSEPDKPDETTITRHQG
jgi:hypothetical protein